MNGETQKTLNQNKEIFPTSRLDMRILIKAAMIFLVASTLYFATRSPGLDEIDSVNFTMGVLNFNVWDHQPHPPGYPVYVAMGKLGVKAFGMTPEQSLYLAGALGGGLFIAAWFLIIRLQFGERLAWWVTISLAITPVVWMTATKVLTDTPATGLASAEILAALCYVRRGRFASLVTGSLFGAAAVGTRPQMFLVVLAILVIALLQRRAGTKMSMLAVATFIAACLLWLVPMWYLQWRLRPDVSGWLVYPKLVYGQWSWRFDKPSVYLGAGDWSPQYIGLRAVKHFLGWLGLGFGFLVSFPAIIIGCVLTVSGLASYLLWRREKEDQEFWKFHRGWALLHILIIFVCLPATQRYYLIIFPLLLVALLRGFLRMPAPWNWSALALPSLLLFITIPLAIENHREAAPPIQFVHYLEKLYPPSMRERVVLVLSTGTKRHVQWYAPGFVNIYQASPLFSAEALTEIAKDATAVYTDDPNQPLPKGWYRVPLASFRRSIVIYWKAHFVKLYLISGRGPECD